MEDNNLRGFWLQFARTRIAGENQRCKEFRVRCRQGIYENMTVSEIRTKVSTNLKLSNLNVGPNRSKTKLASPYVRSVIM